MYKSILDTVGRNKLELHLSDRTWKKWCSKTSKDLQALLIEMEP
jgi:hypothetical protein